MSPEFGATSTLFPIDDETLAYLRLTGRSPERIGLVERYARTQGLWREPGDGPAFDELLELDLAQRRAVRRRAAAAAGPRAADDAARELPVELPERPRRRAGRPRRRRTRARQRRRRGRVGRLVPGVGRAVVRDGRRDDEVRRRRPTPVVADAPPVDGRAYRPVEVEVGGRAVTIRTGSVAIAAITSCTNTSNPTVMVGAGLLARNAVARGLRVGPTVKTSLAPGSRAVTGYLEAAGLMAPLEALGFALAGYGCTTCIGNSGPLDDAVAARDRGERPGRRGGPVGQPQLRGPDPSAGPGELPRLAAAGRRVRARRPGRHRPDHRAARDRHGRPARLPRRHLARARRDPVGHRRVDRSRAVPADLRDRVRGRRPLARAADPDGRPLRLGRRLDLRRQAAVLRRPRREPRDAAATSTALRVLAVLGDSVTTDHISPAGSIAPCVAGRASGSRRTASDRSSSTRTAPGAATTR